MKSRKEANKRYYDTRIKPFRVIKSREHPTFTIRAVCGLCGMNVRPINLKKIQQMRFKTVTSLGNDGFAWLDYNPQGLPEEELKAIRKGIFENVKRLLVYLGLSEIEKQEIAILLNIRVVYLEKSTPGYSEISKNYVGKDEPTYSEQSKHYAEELNPMYVEKIHN